MEPLAIAMQDPWRAGSGPNSAFAGAAGLLQLRLLQAYLLLPKAAAFAPEHASILRLCAMALKGTSAASGERTVAANLYLALTPLSSSLARVQKARAQACTVMHEQTVRLSTVSRHVNTCRPCLGINVWQLQSAELVGQPGCCARPCSAGQGPSAGCTERLCGHPWQPPAAALGARSAKSD